jgi:flagella basal body P-ring formation protein FlgA
MTSRLLLCLILALGASLAAFAATPAQVTDDQLVAALTKDLSAHFQLEGDLQLEMLRPWVPPSTAASSWSVVITEYPPVPSSTMAVRCRVVGDGVQVDDPYLVLRASLWRDAWCARQPLAAGSAFDPTVLQARRVDSFRDRNALPASAGDSSFIFARQVPADRLLSWNDIARRPLVRKGEMVNVVASEGALSVSLRALALENGTQGQLVVVRNLDSRKDISAVVVADSRVEVSF